MKILNISIKKAEILEEVALAAAYSGAKTEAAEGFFDRVATIEDDSGILSRFWTLICGRVADKLKNFITASEISGDSLSLTLELSGAYDDTLSPSVKSDLFSAMASGVTAKWFRITFPARAPEWEDQSAELLERALSKLCHRLPPQRQQSLTI